MILTLRQIVLQCRWSLKNWAPFFDHVFVLYMWEKSYRLVYCEFVRVKNANTYGVWNITVLGPNFHDFHSKSKKYITTFRNNRTTNEIFLSSLFYDRLKINNKFGTMLYILNEKNVLNSYNDTFLSKAVSHFQDFS